MTAIYVALVIYMVVLFGVGLFYSKKNATINDFLLAGRDLGVVAATLAAVLAMVVIIALTSMGGLKAVTVTDGFQIILVMIGVVWVTVVALGDVGGFAGLNSALQSMTSELPTDYNVFMTPAHFKTLLWMILPGFMYVMIGQDIYQRLVACKSHKVALQTSVCSAILAMSVLPNWAVGIIIAASLSAILSTADSCLSAASSHFMTDFYLLYFAKDADPNDKRLVVVSQIFTVVAGAAAVVVSMTIPSILDACFNAYYIFTAGVFCPIVFGVFWKKTTKQGAIAGLVAGGVFVMFALSTGFNIAGIGGELLSGILSAIVLVVVSLATQPKEIARA